jgi:hypothetical protein
MSLAISFSNDITASKKSYTPNRYDKDDEFLVRISLIMCVCVKRLKTSNGRLFVKIAIALLHKSFALLVIHFLHVVNFLSQCV